MWLAQGQHAGRPVDMRMLPVDMRRAHAQVELHVRTQGDAPFTRRGRRRREAGGGDGLQRVFVLGASLLNFRNDKALVGNASTQLPVTPQTQVRMPHVEKKEGKISFAACMTPCCVMVSRAVWRRSGSVCMLSEG